MIWERAGILLDDSGLSGKVSRTRKEKSGTGKEIKAEPDRKREMEKNEE